MKKKGEFKLKKETYKKFQIEYDFWKNLAKLSESQTVLVSNTGATHDRFMSVSNCYINRSCYVVRVNKLTKKFDICYTGTHSRYSHLNCAADNYLLRLGSNINIDDIDRETCKKLMKKYNIIAMLHDFNGYLKHEDTVIIKDYRKVKQ